MIRRIAIAAAVALVVSAAQSASAIQIGLGAGLPGATNLDGGGSRLNIEGQGTVLGPGTYSATSFEYLSSANSGNVQPFLAVNTGGDTYSVIWVGPTDAAPGVAGVNTEFYNGGPTFTLAMSSTVFAGINTSSNIVFFADPDGPSVTDHNNPALFAITPGSAIGPFTNNNLPRNYAFAVNVALIPEPATLTLGGLALAGLALRRRRMA